MRNLINDPKKQTELEATLAECAQTLYISDNVDMAVNRLLEIVAEFYKADRSYIFEFSEDMSLVHNTYEWCAEGITPEIETLAAVDASVISRWLVFFEEKGEFFIDSLNEDVDKDSEEYRILEPQGIESLMAAPLRSNGKLVGFIGVDNPRENTDMLILMRLVAALVVNDLQKRETLEQRVLKTIGNSFVSIHLINLPANTQTEIIHDEKVARFVSLATGAADQMTSVMRGRVAPEQLDSILEFVDLTTVGERIKNIGTLSREFLTVDGHWRRCMFYVMNYTDDGEVNDILFAVQNTDEMKQKELEYQRALKKALENQNEIYAEMLHLQGCGVIAAKTDSGEVIVMNDAAQELFGVPEPGTVLRDVLRPVLGGCFELAMEKLDEIRYEPGIRSLEFWACAVDGRQFYLRSTARTVKLGGGDSIVIITLMDITDKKKLENELVVLSHTDALTGISNRGWGEDCTESLISSGKKGMFCLLDVDKFKQINDSFGHTVGDKALITVADCLRACFTEDDVVMRLGGDEFAVYAVGIEDEAQGGELIRRLIEKIEQTDIPEMNGKRVTISLGAALCLDEEMGFDELYAKADSAMYRCKNAPGNQFGFF